MKIKKNDTVVLSVQHRTAGPYEWEVYGVYKALKDFDTDEVEQEATKVNGGESMGDGNFTDFLFEQDYITLISHVEWNR